MIEAPTPSAAVAAEGQLSGALRRLQILLALQIDIALHHARNRGKGAALRTAIQAASGDVIVVNGIPNCVANPPGDVTGVPAEYRSA